VASSSRVGRSPFSTRRLFAAAVLGAFVGVLLFWLTSMEPSQRTLGLCYPTIEAGFDPWTGLPHGATIYCSQVAVQATPSAVPSIFLPGSTRQDPIPPELANRRAIPVPAGFVVGALVVLVPSAIGRARREK
jgi:hypothetical protein